MQTMFIIHESGKVPRVGYPTGDEATSLREWIKHHPGAAIYVLQAQDLPPPGTAFAQTADEFLAIDEAYQADADEPMTVGLDCCPHCVPYGSDCYECDEDDADIAIGLAPNALAQGREPTGEASPGAEGSTT